MRWDADVYSILCKECKLKCIGEITRNIHKCIFDHKKDTRLGNINNALFLHISKTDHNFDCNAATMLAHIHNKRLRQIFEAGAVSLLPSATHALDFISPFLGKIVLNSYTIFKL